MSFRPSVSLLSACVEDSAAAAVVVVVVVTVGIVPSVLVCPRRPSRVCARAPLDRFVAYICTIRFRFSREASVPLSFPSLSLFLMLACREDVEGVHVMQIPSSSDPTPPSPSSLHPILGKLGGGGMA